MMGGRKHQHFFSFFKSQLSLYPYMLYLPISSSQNPGAILGFCPKILGFESLISSSFFRLSEWTEKDLRRKGVFFFFLVKGVFGIWVLCGMEWKSQDKSVGSSAKRSLSGGEDQKRKEDNNISNNNNNSVIHEGTIFNPSPDAHQTRPSRDPDTPDPIQIPTRPEPVTRYRECQKNHSAHLGTHVLDGCGEFMPDGDLGTLESLNCAACGCHRNFHRKETYVAGGGGGLISASPTPTSNFQISFNARHQHTNLLSPFPFRQAPAIHHHRRFSDQAPPTMMNFGEGGDASSEDLNLFRSDGEGYGGGGSSRKRFRTKFTQEQKDGMMELAERIGWKIQKENENDVHQFCASTGVKRQVFKVWMHNNKQAMKRKQS